MKLVFLIISLCSELTELAHQMLGRVARMRIAGTTRLGLRRTCEVGCVLSRQRRFQVNKPDTESGEEQKGSSKENMKIDLSKSTLWMIIPIIGILAIGYKDFKILMGDWLAPFSVSEVAEDIRILNTKYGTAPIFIRLAWQSCCLYSNDGTGRLNGCLADSGCIYSRLPCNRGMERSIQLLKNIQSKHQISWADLIALAGCVSVEDLGGPRITYHYGRTDGPLDVEKKDLLGKVPDPHKGVNHLKNTFSRLGFNRSEMVALMGGHTVGGIHKYFSGVDGQHSTKRFVFDSDYFVELIENKWHLESNPGEPTVYKNKDGDLTMLPIDIALLADPALSSIVRTFAYNEAIFFGNFASAFEKLLGLGYNDLHATRWLSNT